MKIEAVRCTIPSGSVKTDIVVWEPGRVVSAKDPQWPGVDVGTEIRNQLGELNALSTTPTGSINDTIHETIHESIHTPSPTGSMSDGAIDGSDKDDSVE